MRRLALFLLVGLLAFELAGTASLIASEDCGQIGASRAADDACPPTCLLCGCCAQPVVPALIVRTVSGPLVSAPVPDVGSLAQMTSPDEVLHVPKRSI